MAVPPSIADDPCLEGYWHGKPKHCRVCGNPTKRFGQMGQKQPINLCLIHLTEQAVRHFTDRDERGVPDAQAEPTLIWTPWGAVP